MKKYAFCLWGIMLCATVNFAQGINTMWLFGYQSGSPGFGGTNIDFSVLPASVSYHSRPMNLDVATAEIADAAGNLLFYTNGIYIANANDQPMLNGTGLNPGPFATTYTNTGIPIVQGELILPKPGSLAHYYLFHVAGAYLPLGYVQPTALFYTEVDMTLDGGLGGVLSKNTVAVNDTLCMGNITATKHANGRDWWVLIPEWRSNGYYVMLVTPNGVQQAVKQNSGFAYGVYDWSGQTVFSPDGSKLARYDKDNELNIFDFDRCAGLLSNPEHIIINDSAQAGGVAFSANSRYLYISSTFDIYQFDMQAVPVASSQITVAHYDGFASPFGTNFFLEALAPDGKIYISSTNGENVLGVIEAPDSAGLLCNVQQHSLPLPTYNASTMPNYPNYFLGPVVNSVCDTLTAIAPVDIPEKALLKVVPNPNHGRFTISYATTLQAQRLEIFNALGEKVFASQLLPLSTFKKMDVAFLHPGFYLARVSGANGIVAEKFFVE